MSCSTLSQGATTGFTVSMASLPEGFCPASMQELANAIAARLLVSSNQSFSSFAIGSVEPSSNVGPWLKNCTEWFFFDDATARYIPGRKGGFDSQRVFLSSGSFVVPDFIYKLKIEAWGGGGGGTNDSGGGGGGAGGSGAYCNKIVDVTPGQIVTITVGNGGAAEVGSGGSASAGGNTVCTVGANTITAGGGPGSPGATTSVAGGVYSGADFGIKGGAGQRTIANDSHGAAAPQGGAGGIPCAAGAGLENGVVPGGSGCGGISTANPGGSGAGGEVIIHY